MFGGFHILALFSLLNTHLCGSSDVFLSKTEVRWFQRRKKSHGTQKGWSNQPRNRPCQPGGQLDPVDLDRVAGERVAAESE